MILVTGGAGFIGSNIIRGLNEIGETQICVVDNLTNGQKARNLAGLRICDYIDKDSLFEKGGLSRFSKVRAVFHLGACSNTMETDGRYVMDNNFRYSRDLLEWTSRLRIPQIYASSASVYGNGDHGFYENSACENPLNVYAYSKLLFDEHVRRLPSRTRQQLVGLRFFNVYGPQENHKGKMASVIYHFYHQILESNQLNLFEGSAGFRRDFIHVGDIVKLVLHFYRNPQISGLFNAGTGKAESFDTLAELVLRRFPQAEKRFIPFPPQLQGKYQAFTQAEIGNLRSLGKYEETFMSLNEGVESYLSLLEANDGYLVKEAL